VSDGHEYGGVYRIRVYLTDEGESLREPGPFDPLELGSNLAELINGELGSLGTATVECLQ
jgi:hypothetical protein